MNIMVTGGLGFIGSNFINQRLAKGDTIHNVDKVTYAADMSNIKLPKHMSVYDGTPEPRYRHYHVDVNDTDQLIRIYQARNVEAVVFLFDHNCMKGGDAAVQAVGGFKFLVDAIIHRQYRYRKLRARIKGKKYCPKVIMLVANKADMWWDEQANILWQQQRLGEHKMFDPFREDLIRLQKAGVPTKRGMMATKIGWNVENTLIDVLTM